MVNYIDIKYYETSGFALSGGDDRIEVPAVWTLADTFTLDGIGLSTTSWAAIGGDLRVYNNLDVYGVIDADLLNVNSLSTQSLTADNVVINNGNISVQNLTSQNVVILDGSINVGPLTADNIYVNGCVHTNCIQAMTGTEININNDIDMNNHNIINVNELSGTSISFTNIYGTNYYGITTDNLQVNLNEGWKPMVDAPISVSPSFVIYQDLLRERADYIFNPESDNMITVRVASLDKSSYGEIEGILFNGVTEYQVALVRVGNIGLLPDANVTHASNANLFIDNEQTFSFIAPSGQDWAVRSLSGYGPVDVNVSVIESNVRALNFAGDTITIDNIISQGISSSCGNDKEWCSTYTTVFNNSASNWDNTALSARIDTIEASAIWLSDEIDSLSGTTFTLVNTTSGNLYTLIESTSALTLIDANDYTDVQIDSLSATTFTLVQTTSSDILAESQTRYVNVSGDTMYGNLIINNPTNFITIGSAITGGPLATGQASVYMETSDSYNSTIFQANSDYNNLTSLPSGGAGMLILNTGVTTNGLSLRTGSNNKHIYLNGGNVMISNVNSLTAEPSAQLTVDGDIMADSLSSASISADTIFVGNSSIHFYNGNTISSPDVNTISISNNLQAVSIGISDPTSYLVVSAYPTSLVGGAAGSLFDPTVSIETKAPGTMAFGYTTNESHIISDGDGSIALGNASGWSNIKSEGSGSFATGFAYITGDIIARGSGAIAMGLAYQGSDLLATRDAAIALGYNVSATDVASVAIGYKNLASGSSSFAVGSNAHATHNYAYVWNSDPYNTVYSPNSATYTVSAENGVFLGKDGVLHGDWTVTGTLSTPVLNADTIITPFLSADIITTRVLSADTIFVGNSSIHFESGAIISSTSTFPNPSGVAASNIIIDGSTRLGVTNNGQSTLFVYSTGGSSYLSTWGREGADIITSYVSLTGSNNISHRWSTGMPAAGFFGIPASTNYNIWYTDNDNNFTSRVSIDKGGLLTVNGSVSADSIYLSNSGIYFESGAIIESDVSGNVVVPGNTKIDSLVVTPIIGLSEFNNVSAFEGSLSVGYAIDPFVGTNSIHAEGFGSIAAGLAYPDGDENHIIAGTGSSNTSPGFAFGHAARNSSIKAINKGSFATGMAYASSDIIASGNGSVAMGMAYNTTIVGGGDLISTGQASIAMGQAVSAIGNSDVAIGYKNLADGGLAFAFGTHSHAIHPNSFVYNAPVDLSYGSASVVTSPNSATYTVSAGNGVFLGPQVTINDVTFTGETLTTEVSSLTAAEYMVVKLNGADRVIQLFTYN